MSALVWCVASLNLVGTNLNSSFADGSTALSKRQPSLSKYLVKNEEEREEELRPAAVSAPEVGHRTKSTAALPITGGSEQTPQRLGLGTDTRDSSEAAEVKPQPINTTQKGGKREKGKRKVAERHVKVEECGTEASSSGTDLRHQPRGRRGAGRGRSAGGGRNGDGGGGGGAHVTRYN